MSISGPLLTIIFLLLLNARFAAGQQQAPVPDCRQDDACQQLNQRATNQFKAGDYAEALRLYRLAYDVRSDPRLLYNIARAFHKQGQLAKATPYYQQFLSSAVQDDAQRQKAREYLSQLPPASSNSGAEASAGAVNPTTAPDKKPVYKKWWFWTIVGGLTAATVTGLAVGLTRPREMILEPTF